MSLVVLGTVALDHVKTPSGVKKDMLGGSAAHFAMSARLFTDVHMVSWWAKRNGPFNDRTRSNILHGL